MKDWNGHDPVMLDSSSLAGNRGTDFGKVRELSPAVRFFVARACYAAIPDPDYVYHARAARAAGLGVGAYALWRPEADPQAQIDAIHAQIMAAGGLDPATDQPVWVDVEIDSAGFSHAERAKRLVEFCERAKKALGAIGLYSSMRQFRDNLGNDPALAMLGEGGLDLLPWLADYVPPGPVSPAAFTRTGERQGTWGFHQWGGNAKIPPFPGVVDASSANVLAEGSSETATVRWLQRRLGLTADGSFGPRTAAAVRAFQAANGLAADAVAGARTLSRLMWVR